MSIRSNRPTFAPRLEVLEERALLASGVFVNGTTLTVEGRNKNDTVIFSSVGGGTVRLNGQNFAIDPGITDVIVNTKDGNDRVEVLPTVSAPGELDLTVTVNLGDDEDRFFMRMSKNFVAGAQLDLTVNGGDDDDEITANLRGSHVYDGAVVTLNFNGEDDDDQINVEYKGRVIGDINLNLDGGEDDDWINVNARFRPPEDIGGGEGDTFRVEVNGGDDEDTIGVYITAQPGADYPVVANVNGGGDDDLCNRTPNVNAFSCEEGGVFTFD